ncbi:hypothetical protein A2U01_0047765, partial [Trifolium medium]|nr:hypothetical protein [Trifolium medium]
MNVSGSNWPIIFVASRSRVSKYPEFIKSSIGNTQLEKFKLLLRLRVLRSDMAAKKLSGMEGGSIPVSELDGRMME